MNELFALRLTSEVLAPLLTAQSGAIYGSWSIALQSPSFKRTPNDLDIEVVVPEGCCQEFMTTLSRLPRLSVVRHELIRFSPQQRGRPVKPIVVRAILDSAGSGNRAPDARVLASFKILTAPIYPRMTFSMAFNGQLVSLPLLSLETCLAQKIVRLSQPRSDEKRHTRWQDAADLYDVLCASRSCEVSASQFAHALRNEWKMRGGSDDWPTILHPPSEWLDYWDVAAFVDGVRRPPPSVTIQEVNAQIRELIGPSEVSFPSA